MKAIVWTEPAKTDVRRLDKPSALRILYTLHRFVGSGIGDVKALQGEREELRLRIGDYRLFFVNTPTDAIQIRRVLHRKDAYRRIELRIVSNHKCTQPNAVGLLLANLRDSQQRPSRRTALVT